MVFLITKAIAATSFGKICIVTKAVKGMAKLLDIYKDLVVADK